MKLKNKFKALAGSATIVMVAALFFGCGSQKDVPVTGGESQLYTYTINVTNAEKNGKDEAYLYMTEKFNVKFDFIPVSYADWAEKVRIWMAAGDMPDIIWADIQDYNYNEFIQWAKLELLKPLPEFDNKYPNLKRLGDIMQADDYFNVDGKQYAWTGFRDSEMSDNVAPQGYFYRRDWAEKLGLASDDDTYTWDEFITLTKAFVEQDPGGNGTGKTIAISGTGGAYPEWGGLLHGNTYWESYYKKDGKYVWGIGEPETLEGIKLVKQLHDEGISWKDQVIAGADDGMKKFVVGEVGVLFEYWSPRKVEKVRADFKNAFPDSDPEKAIVPIYIKSPNGKCFALSNPDYWAISMFNANMSDDRMERIMEVYDWIASSEGREYAVKPKDSSMGNTLMDNVVSSRYSYEFEDPKLLPSSIKAVNTLVERQKNEDFIVRKIDYDLYFFVGDNKIKYGTFKEDAKAKMKELIVSSKDIEKDWNEWVESQRPKVKLVLDELNSNLK